MVKFTKKIIKKNKTKNKTRSKTKKQSKSNKDMTPNVGYYSNEQECKRNTVRPNVITNPKFTRFPNIFDQTYFTAGDVADFEAHAYLPLRFKKLKNYSSKKSMELSELHKNYNFQSVKNTFNYIFNHLKKGIFVMIKDNKLDVFLPFSNARFRNSDEVLKQLYLNEEDKDDLKNFVESKDSNDRKLLWNKLAKTVIEKLQPKFKGRLNINRQIWNAQNNCLIKANVENLEGERSLNVYKDFLEQLCESQKVADSVFFLNKKDFPVLKKNLSNPYDDLMDGEVELPEQYRNKSYCPIFSSSITDDFADVLMPTEDDWRKYSGKYYTEYNPKRACKTPGNSIKTDWDSKIEKVIFRGKLTGCGSEITTNIRLKAAKLGKEFPELLDVGLVNFNTRLKKAKNEPVSVFDVQNSDIELKDKIDDTYKLKFKYILNLDGNVSAFRLGSELASGSVVLLPDSPFKMWYSNELIPYKHYVPIQRNLENLIEQVEWCKENDDKCKRISENAEKLHKKIFNKPHILKYFNSKLKEIAVVRSSDFFEKPTTKPNINIITIFREDVTKKRVEQKEKFLKIIPKLYEDDANVKIIVVEQSQDGRKFNIGKLKNIGFDIAIKQKLKGHFIFTDIDMIPDSRLMKYYLKTPEVPTALAIRGTRYSYGNINENNPPFLGGVVTFTEKDFKKVNGFPNNTLGWGGEDDMLRNRIHYNGLGIGYPSDGSIIDLEETSIQNKLMNLKANNLKETQKYEKIAKDTETWNRNGVNGLTYTIESKQKKKNVHHFVVDIETHKDMKENPDLFQFETEVTQNVKITDYKIKQVSA